MGFHDLDCVGLHDELPLASDLLGLGRLLRSGFCSLLFDNFLWDKIATDRIRVELWVNLDLLTIFKDWFFSVLLQEQFDLRVAKLHHRSLKQFR